MYKQTLRRYLFDKRVELLELVNSLKDKRDAVGLSLNECRELECAESALDVVRDIITICNNRNKY